MAGALPVWLLVLTWERQASVALYGNHGPISNDTSRPLKGTAPPDGRGVTGSCHNRIHFLLS